MNSKPENSPLLAAKAARNDEYWTRMKDIEDEIGAYASFNPDVFRDRSVLLPCDDPSGSNFTKYFLKNFSRFGIRELVSTCRSPWSGRQLSLFDAQAPASASSEHGRILAVRAGPDGEPVPFREGLLDGGGDLFSCEVSDLLDKADLVITNPPFSIFDDFIRWICAAGKDFIVMGNKNAITYSEVFPRLMRGEIRIGATTLNGGRWMILPDGMKAVPRTAREEDGRQLVNVGGACWFTSLEHGVRRGLSLRTAEENLKPGGRLIRLLGSRFGASSYPRYDNYDAVEVPLAECVPSDFHGVMGVPITFMERYSPDQFEILGCSESEGKGFSHGLWKGGCAQPQVHGKKVYKRIFIRARGAATRSQA